MTTTSTWASWWLEAKEQLAVARLLYKKHGISAIFHAAMALELASKAVRPAPAGVDALNFSIEELGKYTIGQLGGLEPKKGHDPSEMLRAPWHPKRALAAAVGVFTDVEREVGLANNTLYEACRYPDRWPDGTAAPHTRLTSGQAKRVVDATAQFLRCATHFCLAKTATSLH